MISSDLSIESGLKVVDSGHEGILAAERLDQLDRGAELGEGRNAQHGGVVEVEDAFVGILGQQGVEHGAGLIPVSGEHVSLSDVVGTLAAGQRLGVEGDVTDEVERIEVPVQFGGHLFKRQTPGIQLVENGLLAFGGVPALQEVVEAGESASAAPSS